MDAIKVAKVEHVQCTKLAFHGDGTLHLTAHHLIFIFDRQDSEKEKEMWVPYPLISLVTRLPQTLQGLSPLAFRCRDFETFTLSFHGDQDSLDVFDSVRELTVITSVKQLYAFFYQPNPPFPISDGWSLYSPRDEFARMGVGSRSKAWRFTDVNADYSVCPTYPAQLVIPAKISDTVLAYAAKYRSKGRVPVLAYLHWANNGSITRCSQPLIGLTNNRSIQDEKLVESIFQTHISSKSLDVQSPHVYGATTTNLIVDARSNTAAVANAARGGGTENMEYYKGAKKAYLGVDNIHTIRDSLGKMVDAFREADSLSALTGTMELTEGRKPSLLDRQALRRSGWLRPISALLHGTIAIIRNIHINSSHVLLHCSDGWDRTSQLVSLAEICLDPYYRTMRGFQILIEKDWLSFGHKFADRSGHLSSEKFFQSPPAVDPNRAGGGEAAQAAQAFFVSVQNKFAAQPHLKETSPVFHQFLECLRQIQRQFPNRFEFNELFLRKLHYHLYSCQFGTFLFDCERDRRVGEDGGVPPCEATQSVWDWVNSPPQRETFLNPEFDPSLDDRSSREPGADMGVILFDPKNIRFWHELYGRGDEDMNGRISIPQSSGSGADTPITPDVVVDDEPGGASVTPTGSPSVTPQPLPDISQLSMSQSRSSSRAATPPPTNSGNASQVASDRAVPSVRAESFRPFQSTSSAFSLRSPNSPLSSPSSESWTPSTSRAPAKRGGVAEGFSAGGMKSVWAQLSSNAAAAFSVAQEAYDGVTKDLRQATSPGGGPRGGELQSPDLWGKGASPGSELRTPTSSASGSGAGRQTLALGYSGELNPWAGSASASPSSPSSARPRSPSDRVQVQTSPSWEIPSEEPSLRAVSRSPTSSLTGRSRTLDQSTASFVNIQTTESLLSADSRNTIKRPASVSGVRTISRSPAGPPHEPTPSASKPSRISDDATSSDQPSKRKADEASSNSNSGKSIDPLGVGFL